MSPKTAQTGSRALRFIAAFFAFTAAAVCARQAQTPPPSAVPQGNAQNGKQLFTSRGCADCHGDDAKGLPSKDTGGPQIGPPPVAFAAFVRQVRHPSGMMDPYGPDDISDAELADVYAYLVSLGAPAKPAPPPTASAPPAAPPAPPAPPAAAAPVAGHPDSGRKLYASYGCNVCHGHEGQGSDQPPGPRLAPSRLALAAFVAYVRTPSAQPKTKNSMPAYDGKVLPNTDLVDIYAYLQSLAAPAVPKP